VLQLSQLDLQLTFPCPRPLGKDVENQRSAIENLAVENAFEIAALGRGKLIVKDNGVNVGSVAMLGKLVRFAFANKSGSARGRQFLSSVSHDLSAGGGGQFGQFLQ
jgi:hypothetical protein